VQRPLGVVVARRHLEVTEPPQPRKLAKLVEHVADFEHARLPIANLVSEGGVLEKRECLGAQDVVEGA